MARRGVIVRRLAAVEGLGSCSTIASDKTGSLTCNELTVREIRLDGGQLVRVQGEGFIPEGDVLIDDRPVSVDDHEGLRDLARAALLCNEADLRHRDDSWTWRGHPNDVALLSFGSRLGWGREEALTRFPQVNEIPFELEHRFSATYHREGGRTFIAAKGAPERILGMCDLGPDPNLHENLLQSAIEMAEQGFRVFCSPFSSSG